MTIFTEIIEGKLPGFIIFEDEHHVAILDKYPIDTGHSLVIPKKPYEKITDMPKNEVADLFSLVPQIANAILKATGAVAFSIAQNNGKEAKQIVPSIYFINDGGPFTMAYDDSDIEATKEMLKKRFEKIKEVVRPQLLTGYNRWKCNTKWQGKDEF